MKKQNTLIALSVLSAMSLTAVSPIALNSFSNVVAVSANQSSAQGTVVMNQDADMKYLDTNVDPADGTLAKDKWGQYTGWTRVYKNGDNASLNGQYNDTAWKTAKGEFSTQTGTLNKDSRAYFFRGYFNVDNTSAVRGIHLNFGYKDAVIVYINGQQLTAFNVGSTPSELNINWFSTDSSNGQVQYAKKADMHGAFPEDKAVTVVAKMIKAQADGYYANKATMNNLEENTSYVYRVGNNGQWSDTYTTTTKASGNFSFLFAGDPQLGSSGDLASDKDGWKNTLNLIKKTLLFKNVNFIQNAGDHVEAGKNESQYDAYLSNYEGSVVYSTPFANAVGNHDNSGTAYNDHFNLPNVSQLGNSGEGNAQGDYYYIYNNTLMMVLNSNNRSTAQHEEFIKNTIAKTKDNKDIKWKIVVFHHSIYSSASHASDNDILARRDTLAPMLSENGIDLVLMGHDHVYTRSMLMDGSKALKEESFDQNGQPIHEVTNPKGLTYITANSASGSKYYEFTNNLTGDYIAVKNQEHTPNITKLDVSDNQLKIVTYRTTDLSVVDDFTINKTTTDTVDKTELKNAVDDASKIDSKDYTADSFSKLQDALVKAKTVLNNKNASQDEVNDAFNALKSAKDQLEKKSVVVTPNKDHSSNDKTQTKNNVVKTGDTTQLTALSVAATVAVVTGATIMIKTKKKEI